MKGKIVVNETLTQLPSAVLPLNFQNHGSDAVLYLLERQVKRFYNNSVILNKCRSVGRS